MAVGVRDDGLIVRTEPSQHDALVAEPGTRHFDRTGRPMKGWLIVDAEGCAEDADVRRWIDRGIMNGTQPAAEVARGALLWPTSGGE